VLIQNSGYIGGHLIEQSTLDSYYHKTRSVIVLSNLLNEPFFYLCNTCLPFILRKDLEATACQITLLAMLRPVVALFSFYWSANHCYSNNKLRSNLLWAGILSYAGFLCLPFMENAWFMLLSGVAYTFFYRASMPPWMEILRRNLPQQARERLFALGSALARIEVVFIGVAFGALLDSYPKAWKFLFFTASLFGIISSYLQWRLPIRDEQVVSQQKTGASALFKPWKENFALLKARPDFARFQWGFMACGFGIMLAKPAQTLFQTDVLQISYTEMAFANSVCYALGFVLFSPFWTKGLSLVPLNHFSHLVFFCFGIFHLLFMFASFHIFWLFAAHFFYGIAQAGSHLLLHMSGPLFARSENSSQFSRVNVMMVGIRGLIAPPLGALICYFFGPLLAFVVAMLCCFYGNWLMLFSVPDKQPVSS
jgi:hypothetical protein